MILRELARNAPTVFNVHVPAFIDAIWPALRDQSLAIREAAVRALRECLVVIEKREDRKSTRLNSSHSQQSRMPSSA